MMILWQKKAKWLFIWSFTFLASSEQVYAVHSEDEQLMRRLQEFAAAYAALKLPGRSLSYVDNLSNIQDAAGLERQRQFFQEASDQAAAINKEKLTNTTSLFYRQWVYEIALNLERIQLEKRYAAGKHQLNDKGLYYQQMGKAWYGYFIKEFLSLDITPEELIKIGISQVQQVKEQMKAVQYQLGYARDSAAFYAYLNDSSFFITNEDTLLQGFERTSNLVQERMAALFLPSRLSPVTIRRIQHVDQNSPPGYYSRDNQTFYFNFYQQKFNSRGMDFLFLHEGIPGHHYQLQVAGARSVDNPLRDIFWYMAYEEGWAAYCEELGHTLGLYRQPEAHYGKLEWDLVRSVRMVMDVGLNYDGWTKAQALAYWKQHVYNQDQIAMREIERMVRWPVQVHSYKTGAIFIENMRKAAFRQQGEGFELPLFHEWYLGNGPLPLAILKQADEVN